jgi:hypothetical protein
MKKFIILSVVALAGVSAALACGPSPTPNYYMFSVYNREQMNDRFSDGFFKYWSDYTGGKASKWDMEALANLDPNDLANSNNPIVQTGFVDCLIKSNRVSLVSGSMGTHTPPAM